MNKYEENVYKCLFEYPTKKIVELELENEKLQEEKEHYKHLYSEVKKQKDDVVEYIKYNATSNYFDKDKNMFRREIDLLRMLGEIDE